MGVGEDEQIVNPGRCQWKWTDLAWCHEVEGL